MWSGFLVSDQLLVVSTDQLKHQMCPPDAIVQTLLYRKSICGLFLALAEAHEQESGGAAVMTGSLSITPSQVNQAHGSITAWAQDLAV